jgi:hypothetical protein
MHTSLARSVTNTRALIDAVTQSEADDSLCPDEIHRRHRTRLVLPVRLRDDEKGYSDLFYAHYPVSVA